MEPPTKRPRFGPAPFDDDDSDADELNSRPEEVNARRDPGLRLERSRAFAAFKLKSAFERIFDKYEKDFTGVGDEINLRTGEVIIDNGHLESLKDVKFGGEDDEDDETNDYDDDGNGSTVSGVPSLNDEEKKLQGKPDNRLSRLGQLTLPSIPRQIDAPPFFGTGWSGATPVWGGPPRLGSMMYPGQMQFGSFPMQFPVSSPMPTTDPTWSTPELPSPFLRNGPMPMKAPVLIKKKKVRLSLTAAPELGGDNEDDISLGVTATTQNEGMSGEAATKRRLLLPRLMPETTSRKKKKRSEAAPKPRTKGTIDGVHKRPKKSAVDEKFTENPTNPTTEELVRTAQTNMADSNLAPTRQGQDDDTAMELFPPEPAGPICPVTPVVEATREESAQKDAPREDEAIGIGPSRPNQVASTPTTTLQPEDPDVYINLSSGELKLTKKPRNQRLHVEIVVKNLPDIGSFRIVSPEPSEADLPVSEDVEGDEPSLTEVPAASELMVVDTNIPGRMASPERADLVQPEPVETFVRNTVDSAYDFSDEDEPTLPRKRAPQTQLKNIANEASPTVSDKVCEDFDPGSPTEAIEIAEDDSFLDVDGCAAPRAPSPTLSLKLDGYETSAPNEPLQVDEERPRQTSPELGHASLVLETPEYLSNGKNRTFDETPTLPRISMDSINEAEKAMMPHKSTDLPYLTSRPRTDTETVESRTTKKRKQSLAQETRQQKTSTGAAGIGSLSGRKKEPTKAVGRRTSSGTQTSDRSRPEVFSLIQTLEIPDSDPPSLLGERTQTDADMDDTPLPPPADPVSDLPQAKIHSPPKERPPPSTPTRGKTKTKTRKGQISKLSQTPPLTTETPNTTSKKKRKGILSLLPSTLDDEDELSIPVISTPTTLTTNPQIRLSVLSSASNSHLNSRSGSRTGSGKKVLANRAIAPPGSASKSTGRRTSHLGNGGRLSTPSAGPGSRSKRRRTVAASTPQKGNGEQRLAAATPSAVKVGSEMVQTPGGTMRRCGEGGFRCERDFCFVCY